MSIVGLLISVLASSVLATAAAFLVIYRSSRGAAKSPSYDETVALVDNGMHQVTAQTQAQMQHVTTVLEPLIDELREAEQLNAANRHAWQHDFTARIDGRLGAVDQAVKHLANRLDKFEAADSAAQVRATVEKMGERLASVETALEAAIEAQSQSKQIVPSEAADPDTKLARDLAALQAGLGETQAELSQMARQLDNLLAQHENQTQDVFQALALQVEQNKLGLAEAMAAVKAATISEGLAESAVDPAEIQDIRQKVDRLTSQFALLADLSAEQKTAQRPEPEACDEQAAKPVPADAVVAGALDTGPDQSQTADVSGEPLDTILSIPDGVVTIMTAEPSDAEPSTEDAEDENEQRLAG